MTDPTVQPPQVEAYLARLDVLLEGTDPAARADTVLGVREHIDDALAAVGPDPTAEQIQTILDRLGPPEDVAGAAEPKTGRRPYLTGGWVAPVVLLLQLVGIVGSIFLLPTVGVIAACVIVGLSPLWKLWEKIASIVASVVSVVVFVVVVAGSMSADECYDEATGEGMNAADQPIEGLKACSEVAGSVDIGGLLFACLGALAVAVLIFLAVRAARRANRGA